jgi:multidrug efflux pump subunit AcrA (membrane-fusion protein)
MPAAISLREFPDQHFAGVVSRFAHSLDLSTRTMLTEIDLDNRTHRLYPRMYASVTLELIRHPRAIQLPSTAVELSGETHFVYAVRDESLVQVPVSIGFSDGHYTEIASGLTGQELIVSNISPALNNGEKVKAIVLGDARSRARDGEVASTH